MWSFDTTCCLHQYRSYMNHVPVCKPCKTLLTLTLKAQVGSFHFTYIHLSHYERNGEQSMTDCVSSRCYIVLYFTQKALVYIITRTEGARKAPPGLILESFGKPMNKTFRLLLYALWRAASVCCAMVGATTQNYQLGPSLRVRNAMGHNNQHIKIPAYLSSSH